MKKKLLLIVGMFLLFATGLMAQSVVINKIYNNTNTSATFGGGLNGQGDGVELLVLDDHVDLRGVYIKDFYNMSASSTAFVEGGHYQFTQDDLWKDLRSGTTITLIRPAISPAEPPALDVDVSDYIIQIPFTNASSTPYITQITTTNSYFFNPQGTDGIVLKRGTSPLGFDNVIHFFYTGYGNNATLKAVIDAFTFPKMLTSTTLPGGTTASGFAYANNPSAAVTATLAKPDYNGINSTTNNIIATSTTTAPAWGVGEPSNNANLIASLREASSVVPVVFGNIVINRVFNSGVDRGEGDMLELLILNNNTDIRGMYLKDIAGGTSTGTSYDDNGGKYQFSQDPLWNNMKAGTTIVIRVSGNAAFAEEAYDVDANDSRIDINMLYQKSSKYLNYLSGTFNLQNYDLVMLKAVNATGGADGSLGAVHTFVFGITATYSTAYNAIPTPKIGSSAPLSSSSGYQYVSSPTNDIDDYNGRGANVINTTSTETVWGDGHPGANADFITSLRPTTTVGDGPSVVINRIFNSTTVTGVDDVVELLVIKDHTDMRGMYFKDTSAGTSSSDSFGDSGGKFQFSENALWSDLRSGTTIVLRGVASTVTEDATDADASDYRLDINLKASAYLVVTGTATSFNLQNYDMVMLKTRASGSAGFTGAIHSFLTGIYNSNAAKVKLYNDLVSPKLGSAVFLNGTSTSSGYQYALSPTQSPNDFNGRGATYVGNSTTLIPVWGNGHPGNNADYIASLRPVIANQPVIRSGQDYSVDENSPAGTVVGKATATLRSTGTLSNWAILYGNTNNMFAIDPSSGIITLTGTSLPDYETMPAYTLTLEVYNGSVRSNSVPIIVNVRNLEEELTAPKITGAVNGRLNGFLPEVTGVAEYSRNIALYVDDMLVTDTITTSEIRANWTARIYNTMSAGTHTFYFTSTGTGAALKTSPVTTVTFGTATTEIVPYNLLTPNGDGKNDVWKITNLQLYPINEVVVFDKVGKVVYRQNNYQQDWAGTSNGEPLQSGTYYYQVSFGPDLKPLKGYITIIRRK